MKCKFFKKKNVLNSIRREYEASIREPNRLSKTFNLEIIKTDKNELKTEQNGEENNLDYKFFWLSNKNNEENKKSEWIAFTDNDLNLLKKAYEIFIIDKNNFLVELNPPSFYIVDLKRLILYEKENKKICYLVKREVNFNSTKEDGDYDQYLFFYTENYSSDFPIVEQNLMWEPYSLFDQQVLKAGYYEYMKNPAKNFTFLMSFNSVKVNFENMIEYKYKSNHTKIVQFVHPNLVFNLSRDSRVNEHYPFLYFHVASNNKYTFESRVLEEFDKIKKLKFDSNQNLIKNMNILFDKDIMISIELMRPLFFYPYIPNKICFSSFKKELMKELKNLLEKNGKGQEYKFYEKILTNVENFEKFLENIVKIITAEGSLWQLINNYLKLSISKDEILSEIQYIFISLLVCFEHFKNSGFEEEIEKNSDFTFYMCSKSSTQKNDYFEENIYNSKDTLLDKLIDSFDKCVIFRDFLSVNFNKDNVLFQVRKNEENYIKYIWEINVPNEILRMERGNFLCPENFSFFKNEKEILLKCGSIFEIIEKKPFSELIDGELKSYENKFYIKANLTSLSYKTHLENLFIDSKNDFIASNDVFLKKSHKELNLKLNDLCKIEKMEILKQTIHGQEKFFILNLGYNKLGKNEACMNLLKIIIEETPYIGHLNLEYNSLGMNLKSVDILKEFIIANKTLKIIDLSGNDFGNKIESMQSVKIFLYENNYLKNLIFRANNLGYYIESMKIFKDGLLLNRSILELNLSDNEIGFYDESMSLLKELLIYNNTILSLDLTNNEIGKNKRSMIFLQDMLINNTNLKYLNISNNEIGLIKDNMIIIKDIICGNKYIETIHFEENFLCYYKENLEILESIFENPITIKKIYIDEKDIDLSSDKFELLRNIIENNDVIYASLEIQKKIIGIEDKANNTTLNNKIKKFPFNK